MQNYLIFPLKGFVSSYKKYYKRFGEFYLVFASLFVRRFFVIVDKVYNSSPKDYSINFKHFIKLPKLFRKCKTTTFRPGQFQFAVRHELENERR